MYARCLGWAARFGLLVAMALTMSLSAAHAGSCKRAPMPVGAQATVPTQGFDQKLFSKVILVEVNYQRCRAGLAPLKLANGLITVASKHAQWMARSGQLSHTSTMPGYSSVRQRVLASGLKVHRGSENIGYLPRYRFEGNRKIRIRNMSRCQFTTTSGRPIGPHSYASLGAEIVRLWMKSKGHRRNLLDRNVNTVGAALGYDADGMQCGKFFMAQNFAG